MGGSLCKAAINILICAIHNANCIFFHATKQNRVSVKFLDDIHVFQFPQDGKAISSYVRFKANSQGHNFHVEMYEEHCVNIKTEERKYCKKIKFWAAHTLTNKCFKVYLIYTQMVTGLGFNISPKDILCGHVRHVEKGVNCQTLISG